MHTYYAWHRGKYEILDKLISLRQFYLCIAMHSIEGSMYLKAVFARLLFNDFI